jgi:hypothetical protein
MTILDKMEESQIDGYISSDRMWAAVPWHKNKYISIYNGQQICVHHSLETAKKFIQKETRRKK